MCGYHAESSGRKNDGALRWWTAYNKIKHQRDCEYGRANLKNVLNAVAGLFVMTLCLYRDKARQGELVPSAVSLRAEQAHVGGQTHDGYEFGFGASPWNSERVLDRYELLYEAGLVAESILDRGAANAGDGAGSAASGFGASLTLDHRRILATALGRLRGKLKYRPLVFELLPDTFTLFQLQRTVEALVGVRLHKQNFRRLVERGGLVEGTGRLDPETGGRPAALFQFRREVLLERPAPGVGLPGLQARH